MKSFAYFPGCVIPVNYPHIEKITLDMLKRFNIELLHLEGFSCCPEPIEFASLHPLTTLGFSARNLAIAQETGLDILTACNGCTLSLKDAADKLEKDPELLGKVNEVLQDTPFRYNGGVKVYHFLEVFKDIIGRDKLAASVTRPLTGVRIATHTGCHLLSPPELIGFEADPGTPVEFDQLIEAIGGIPVDYATKTLCCGISHSLGGTPKSSFLMVKDKIVDVDSNRVDCMAVGCPSCLSQLDKGQHIVARKFKLDISIPVLYFTQLLGLALGLDLKEVGYMKNRVKNKEFQQKIEGLGN